MKAISPVMIEPHEFSTRDIIAGDAALDFVNTVTGRDQSPRDWLDSYARLLEWAERVQLMPEKQLHLLARKAQREPKQAANALVHAKELREAMFALMTSIIADKSPPKVALALVRERWVEGTDAHELRVDNGCVIASLRTDVTDFELVAAMIAYRLVQQVLPLPKDRLRICQGPNCAWLFIDASKAGRRRWCDMAVCGNAAKSRRFHARLKGGAEVES